MYESKCILPLRDNCLFSCSLQMTVDLIEGLAGETARIEEQRRLQSEQARKRWNTKRAKLQQVAQLFVQANSSVAESVPPFCLAFNYIGIDGID